MSECLSCGAAGGHNHWCVYHVPGPRDARIASLERDLEGMTIGARGHMDRIASLERDLAAAQATAREQTRQMRVVSVECDRVRTALRDLLDTIGICTVCCATGAAERARKAWRG